MNTCEIELLLRVLTEETGSDMIRRDPITHQPGITTILYSRIYPWIKSFHQEGKPPESCSGPEQNWYSYFTPPA